MKMTKRQLKDLDLINVARIENGLTRLHTLVAPAAPSTGFRPLTLSTVTRRGGSMDFNILSSRDEPGGIAEYRSVMDPRSLAAESKETRDAIIAKSRCLAPAYSKGAYQYVTPGMDPTDLGKKK